MIGVRCQSLRPYVLTRSNTSAIFFYVMAYSPLRTLVGLVAVFHFFIPALSLEVTDASKCRGECGDRKNTLTTDLVCQDSSFNTTANGITMKNCLLCESTGTTYLNNHSGDLWDFLCMYYLDHLSPFLHTPRSIPLHL